MCGTKGYNSKRADAYMQFLSVSWKWPPDHRFQEQISNVIMDCCLYKIRGLENADISSETKTGNIMHIILFAVNWEPRLCK